jgi:hypothetical protein
MAWDAAKAYLEATGGQAEDPTLYLWLIQQDVRRFLRRPKAWRAVTAVAEGLLQQGTIAGKELYGLLTATYGRRR